MNTHTLFEHEPRSYELLGLSDKEKDLIEKLNQDNVPLFKVGRHTLTATQYVGIVQIQDHIIQVLPKIQYTTIGGESSEVYSAQMNFLHMLSYAYQIPIKALETVGLRAQRSNWLELLTSFFVTELRKQFQSGIYRNYQNVEERLPTIKGKWLFSRQAVRWMYDRTHFDVEYDEFSENNDLNKVFLYAVNQLLTITKDNNNFRALHELRVLLNEVDPNLATPQESAKKIKLTRLNERFSVSLNLAKMFIEKLIIQMSPGQIPVLAFMFDMNQLFQEFVVHFLQQHQGQIFPDPSNVDLIVSQAKGRNYRFLQQVYPGQKEIIRLKPDIMLYDEIGGPILIIDTKYERLSKNEQRLAFREQNFYQMFAYSRIVNCPQVLLLFPKNDVNTIRERYQVINQNVEISVATIDLNRPLEDPWLMITEFQNIFRGIKMYEEENYGTRQSI